jgi:hypothetical protein
LRPRSESVEQPLEVRFALVGLPHGRAAAMLPHRAFSLAITTNSSIVGTPTGRASTSASPTSRRTVAARFNPHDAAMSSRLANISADSRTLTPCDRLISSPRPGGFSFQDRLFGTPRHIAVLDGEGWTSRHSLPPFAVRRGCVAPLCDRISVGSRIVGSLAFVLRCEGVAEQ